MRWVSDGPHPTKFFARSEVLPDDDAPAPPWRTIANVILTADTVLDALVWLWMGRPQWAMSGCVMTDLAEALAENIPDDTAPICVRELHTMIREFAWETSYTGVPKLGDAGPTEVLESVRRVVVAQNQIDPNWTWRDCEYENTAFCTQVTTTLGDRLESERHVCRMVAPLGFPFPNMRRLRQIMLNKFHLEIQRKPDLVRPYAPLLRHIAEWLVAEPSWPSLAARRASRQ